MNYGGPWLATKEQNILKGLNAHACLQRTQQWTRTARQKLHKRPCQVSKKWYGLKHPSTSVEHLLIIRFQCDRFKDMFKVTYSFGSFKLFVKHVPKHGSHFYELKKYGYKECEN